MISYLTLKFVCQLIFISENYILLLKVILLLLFSTFTGFGLFSSFYLFFKRVGRTGIFHIPLHLDWLGRNVNSNSLTLVFLRSCKTGEFEALSRLGRDSPDLFMF